jgi:hypothetical protein
LNETPSKATRPSARPSTSDPGRSLISGTVSRRSNALLRLMNCCCRELTVLEICSSGLYIEAM